MLKEIRVIGLFLSGVVLTIFVLFLVSQTNAVVQLASGVNATFGEVVLYSLVGIYGILLFVPVYLFLRMRAPLIPPKNADPQQDQRFRHRLAKRLRSNPECTGLLITTQADVEKAIAALDKKAKTIIEQIAIRVFLTTTISQSGRLDAFIVLNYQTRMIWRIAHLYNQRPSLRDFLYLYSNVAATLFLVQSIEDIDIEEYVEPLLAGLTGAGISLASSFVAASVFDGVANTFMTLRIGLITQKYCGALTYQERNNVRKSAIKEAGKIMLGPLMKSTLKDIIKMVKNRIGGHKSKEMEQPSRSMSEAMKVLFRIGRAKDQP